MVLDRRKLNKIGILVITSIFTMMISLLLSLVLEDFLPFWEIGLAGIGLCIIGLYFNKNRAIDVLIELTLAFFFGLFLGDIQNFLRILIVN